MKAFLSRISALFVIIAAVVFFLNLIIDNPYTHAVFRAAVNQALRQNTNVDLSFESLSLSIIPLGANIYGNTIDLVDEESDERHRIATAARVRVQVSFLSLFMGEPRLGLVEVSDLSTSWPPPWTAPPVLKPTAESDSTKTKGEKKDAKPAWPPSFKLPIERMRISNARIHAEHPITAEVPLQSSWIIGSAEGISLDIKYKSWEDIKVALSVKSIDSALDEGYILESAEIEVRGDIRGREFVIGELAVNGERVQISGTAAGMATVSDDGTRLQDLKLESEVEGSFDLSLLGSLLDLNDTRGHTKVSGRLRTTIPLDDREFSLLADGDLQISDGYLGGFRLYESTSKFTVNTKKIDLNGLVIVIDQDPYAVFDGTIHFDEPYRYSFVGEPRGLHLIDLLVSLGVDFDHFDFELFSDKITIDGVGEPFSMDIRSDAQLRSIRVPLVEDIPAKGNVVPPSCNFNLAINLDSDKLDLSAGNGICSSKPIPRGELGYAVRPSGSEKDAAIEVKGIIGFGSHDTSPEADNQDIDLNVHVRDIPLSFASYFARIPLGGTGTAKTRIWGPYDHVLVDSQVQSKDTFILGANFGSVTANVTVDEKIVKWKDGAADLPEGGKILTEFGSISVDDLRLVANVQAKNLSKESIAAFNHSWVGIPELGFSVSDIRANLNGPVLKPGRLRGHIRGQMLDLSWAKETIADEIDIKMTARPKGWDISPIELRKGEFIAVTEIQHESAGQLDLAPGDGGSDSGSDSDSDSGSGSGKGTDNVFSALGLSPKDRITARITTQKTEETPKDKKNRGSKRKSQGKSNDHLTHLPFVGKILEETKISGLLDLEAKLSGTLDKIQGTISGTTNRLVVLGSATAPIRIKGFVRDSDIDLTFDHSGNSLNGRLSFDFLQDGVPFEWYLALNQMDLRPIVGDFFFRDARNYLYASAAWRMDGHFADWWNADGSIEIKKVDGKYVIDNAHNEMPVFVSNKKAAIIHINRGGWNTVGEGLVMASKFGELRVEMVGNRPPENLKIGLDSQIKLKLLESLFPSVESSGGSISIGGEITGKLTEPKYKVTASDVEATNQFLDGDWEPVSIGLADLRPSLQDIEIDVRVDNGRVNINELTADKGNGNISAQGTMILGDDRTGESAVLVEISEAALSYPVPMLKSFDTTIDGSVAITGNRPPFRVAGQIDLKKARSTRPFDLRGEIVEAIRKKSISGEGRQGKPLAEIDIGIRGEKSIIIKNRNFDAVMSTNLRITGTDKKPSISGFAQVDRGTFLYQREFEIQRGILTFDDPVRTDPSLDVVATAEVNPYTVEIVVSGRASNPTIEFNVDPPTQDDGTPITPVDTLILLSRGSLPKSQNNADASQVVTTQAANLILGQFQQPLDTLLDQTGQNVVRNIYFDIYASEEDGSPTPRANFPINLGSDVDALVKAAPDSAGVSVEYPLHDSIAVSGQFKKHFNVNEDFSENDGDTGVDLRFRFSIP